MNSQFEPALLQQMEESGVIAVLVLDNVQHAVPLARALLAGGVNAMELTLRTPAALDGLKAIRQEVPEMLAGIGTVLTQDQVRAVRDAGAAFGVAPGTNARVIRCAQECGLPFAPGVATPSDVELAIELGCRDLKFFPAEPLGGMSYLKSMAAPYLHLGVRFVPLGGLNVDNAAAYLRDPLILAVGGSWVAPRKLIVNEDWTAIERNARQARDMAFEVRQGTNE